MNFRAEIEYALQSILVTAASTPLRPAPTETCLFAQLELVKIATLKPKPQNNFFIFPTSSFFKLILDKEEKRGGER